MGQNWIKDTKVGTKLKSRRWYLTHVALSYHVALTLLRVTIKNLQVTTIKTRPDLVRPLTLFGPTWLDVHLDFTWPSAQLIQLDILLDLAWPSILNGWLDLQPNLTRLDLLPDHVWHSTWLDLTFDPNRIVSTFCLGRLDLLDLYIFFVLTNEQFHNLGGISIPSFFLLNFKFYFFSYLKYLIKNFQIQFLLNLLLKTYYFPIRILNSPNKWIIFLNCLIQNTL